MFWLSHHSFRISPNDMLSVNEVELEQLDTLERADHDFGNPSYNQGASFGAPCEGIIFLADTVALCKEVQPGIHLAENETRSPH
jgi:hypothetical protein